MIEFDDNSEGISPQTAGVLLGVVALIGVGLFVVGSMVNRSSDSLYDVDNQGGQTSSRLMETQNLWKKKEPLTAENSTSPSAPTSPAARDNRPASTRP